MLPAQKIKRAIISTLIAALFLILTALFAFHAFGSVIYTFCFAFHLIPFGIAYSGGSEVYIVLYYIVLWALFSFVIYVMLSLIVKRSED
jgi:hypothetical protein